MNSLGRWLLIAVSGLANVGLAGSALAQATGGTGGTASGGAGKSVGGAPAGGTSAAKNEPKSCVLTPKPPIRNLYVGANLQVIDLSESEECGKAIAAGSTVYLVKDDLKLAAAASRPSNVLRFQIEAIKAADSAVPSNVTPGTWSVKDGAGHELGSVYLGVVSNAFEVTKEGGGPLLGVHYGVKEERELDTWHNGKSSGGLAVVTAARGDYYQYVQNTASLNVPEELKAWGALLIPERNLKARQSHAAANAAEKADEIQTDPCEDLESKCDPRNGCDANSSDSHKIDECRRTQRPWRVRATTWEDSVWLGENGWWRQGEDIFSRDPSEITFAVSAAQVHPLTVAIELVEPNATNDPKKVLFRQYVTLANGARYESLPLPLAQALYVECGHHVPLRGLFVSPKPKTDADSDVISHGYTAAVNDDDVLSGNCRLHYSPGLVIDTLNLDRNEQSRDLLKYYGRQELTVSVRRGEVEQAFAWSVDPSLEQEVRLPVPRDARNATGLYAVTAGLRGPLPPAVVWRTSNSQTLATAASDLGELEFRANLRPRGPFGWKIAPIRVFLTFPVSFTGVRFPARPSENTASSDSANVQAAKIQAGALLALEPWNYDTGRNPWPVPVRFVTGMNVYDISEGRFTPSLLTGLSFTLPIIDLQKGVTEDQLSSDVALGLFWEADVAERHWLKRGNHFLITFGVNLLSLFGSK